jgi:hypothetical protein
MGDPNLLNLRDLFKWCLTPIYRVGGVGHPAAVADSEKSFTHAVSVTLTLFACL